MTTKSRAQKKHAKAIARKKKNRKPGQQRDRFAFLEKHTAVQKKPEPFDCPFPPLTVLNERRFEIASTFPAKYPDVMALLDQIEQQNLAGKFYYCDLNDDQAEQIAQMVRSRWLPTDEELAILEPETKPEQLSLEHLVEYCLDNVLTPADLNLMWIEDTPVDFNQSCLAFEQFVAQDWPCKLFEYLLVNQKLTSEVTSETLGRPIVIETQLVDNGFMPGDDHPLDQSRYG